MPVVTEPGYYDQIITYQNHLNPAIKWRNTYTFSSVVSPPVNGAGIVQAISAFAVGLVHSDTDLVETAVYNWARGRQPYPLGSPLFVDVGAVPGTADTNWPHLATPYDPPVGSLVLRIDHQPNVGGKPGRNFYRALLGDEDIDSVSGGPPALVPTVANLQADLNALLTASGLHNYFDAGLGNQFLALVRFSKKTFTVNGTTSIHSFNVIDATENKRSRKNKR